MESFFHMKFAVTPGKSHNTRPSTHKGSEQDVLPFLSKPRLPPVQWPGSKKTTGHLGSPPHFPSDSQLPGRLASVPPASPSFPLDSVTRDPCLTLKTFVLVHHSLISGFLYPLVIFLWQHPLLIFLSTFSLSLTFLFSVHRSFTFRFFPWPLSFPP